MSIADTITSIENHLSADYEGLTNLGVDLTGINKNILNIRTILDNIYNDLPKVTGEGTEVTLTPTRKGRLALIPKGNSEQGQKKSPNLYNVNDFLSGLDYSVDSEGFITISYDNTSGSTTRNSSYHTNNLDIQASTTYLLVAEIKSVSGEGTIYFTNRQGNTNQGQFPNFYKSFNQLSNGEILTEQITSISAESMASVTRGLRTVVTFGAGKSGSITFRLSVLADTTITPQTFHYLPFGNLDPQPYFPIPIKSVTGNNNVVLKTKNMINMNASYVKRENASYSNINISDTSLSYNITSNVAGYLGYVIPVTIGEKYTLSFILNKGLMYLVQLDEAISQVGTNYGTEVSNGYTFTATKQYVGVWLSATTSTESSGNVSNLMLEKGETASAFQPYSVQTKPLNLGSIELNKIGTYQDYIFKSGGNWYKHEEIGKVVFNGSEEWSLLGVSGVNSMRVALSNATKNYGANSVGLSNMAVCQFADQLNKFYFATPLQLVIDVDSTYTLETWKAYLANNNLEIRYVLNTPQDIQITDTQLIEQLEDIDKMQSYNGTTIITSTYDSNNAQMILEVSSLKGE